MSRVENGGQAEMLIRSHRDWEIAGLEATPEEVYWNRRRFLKRAGRVLASAGAIAFGCGTAAGADDGKDGEDTKRTDPPAGDGEPKPKTSPYPAPRNPEFKLDRDLTPLRFVANYNNFYEFSFDKRDVARLAQRLETSPWKLEVKGLVQKPRTFDVDDLVRELPLEERLYRFRCVEAWAMAVPWTGFVLRKLMDRVQPLASAKFVRFLTFKRPEWGIGFEYDYPWPYHEALTIEEAANELTLLVTGLYGKPLPKQNGAPVRLITPWKYGFKSIKSIVSIEFTAERPATFWNTLVPDEYDFQANVDPQVPHPRWSQATERMIDTGKRVPTQLYNGYAKYVADLYKK